MSTELKKKKEKEKTDEKKQTKNWKKSSNYLLFIVIDRFGDQSLWNQSTETVNPGLRIASPRRVDQTHRT